MDNIQEKVFQITSILEETIDNEMNRLEKLSVSDYEKIRDERLKALKKQDEQKRKWLAQGHGQYSELPEEKNFFDITKSADRVVCHFYRDGAMRCKIVDKHLKILAQKHVETRFITLNAPKCPFLAERLKIVVIPTILVIVDRIAIDRIEGFTDLGNRDDFDTAMMEWRLAKSKAIFYDGDLLEPPTKAKKKTVQVLKKKAIRETESDSDSELSD